MAIFSRQQNDLVLIVVQLTTVVFVVDQQQSAAAIDVNETFCREKEKKTATEFNECNDKLSKRFRDADCE